MKKYIALKVKYIVIEILPNISVTLAAIVAPCAIYFVVVYHTSMVGPRGH